MVTLLRMSLIFIISINLGFSKNNELDIIVPGVVVMKLVPGTELISRSSQFTGISAVDNVLSLYSIEDISPVVPYKIRDPRLPDINRIYKVKFFDDIDPRIISNQLNKLEGVLYAEPRFIYQKSVTPDDPFYANQWHLPAISANSAWNTTTGDTNVVIAIVDDAVDIHHEDLAANIFTNWAEYHGDAGVDDDNNGYIDDIHGWDFAEDDNDPSPVLDTQTHGTHVAGCAAAVTDNNIGVAAPGWSCKILPLKFSNDETGTLSGDNLAAIIYAADMGASITNNSYSSGGFSQYSIDVFQYAYDLGTLSFAAASNSNLYEPRYPAALPHVISVASTEQGDIKSGFSTYHISVDISSPGTSIYSTVPNNGYGNNSGTSMASPVAAGVAGLIKSQFPDLTSYELALRISATTDDIYDVNPDYNLFLGSGRINANKAVTYTESQFVDPVTRIVLISSAITDTAFGNSDFVYDPGEKVQVGIELYNYSLVGSDFIDLELSTSDENLTFINRLSNVSINGEDTLEISNAFDVEISGSAEVGSAVMELSISQNGIFVLSYPIVINIGTAPVLIVDDDNNGENDPKAELFYTTILDSLGINYFIHDRTHWPLLIGQLAASPIVIWISEWSFPSLDADDRDVLSQYLDMGGNLYVSGQDLGWDLNENPGDSSQTEFFSNYLHAVWGGDHSGTDYVLGIPNNSISDGLEFNVYQPGYELASQYPDYFTPKEDAEQIFQYDNGLGMGISYAGDHRVVYTGVGLETFGSTEFSVAPDDVNEVQETFLERTLNFLNFISHTPLRDTQDSTATIEFHVKLFNDGEGMTIPSLTYQVGDEAEVTVEMKDTLDGYFYSIDGPDATVSVKYSFSVGTVYYDWTNPINTDTPFIFNIGRDLIPPVLMGLSTVENRIDRSGSEELLVSASDNIGVGEVDLHWYYSSSPTEVETVSMVLENNRWVGTLAYTDLPGSEVVYYFASATDSSADANVGYSDTLSFVIINTTVLTDWDNDVLGPWDTGDNWGLQFINSVLENGMNDSPDTRYENNKLDTLTLLTPFDISDYNTAYLQFWTGSALKTGDFGHVELSGNMTDWVKKYTISGNNGGETIILDANDYIETGVYIRFLIHTNGSDVSQGWFIDDIILLADTTADTTIVLSTSDHAFLPKDHKLYQNFPNPFNPVTTIYYDVPVKNNVDIMIYDLLGRRVKTLYNGMKNPGNHSVIWNGKDNFGKPVSAGVYFYQFHAGDFVQTRKMVLLK